MAARGAATAAGKSVSGAGGSCSTLWNMPVIESASKGRRPVTSSKSTTPREKMSARPSTALPATCSGGM